MINIPAEVRELPEGLGTSRNHQTREWNDSGEESHRRARLCAPMAAGTRPYHHYLFELDTKLDVSPDARRAEVLKSH